MEVVWTAEAERHLSALADSSQNEGGTRAAAEVVGKTLEGVGRLADTPYIGRRLAGRRGAYRAISVELWFAVIYRVVAHKVVVIGIWDCRREPLDLSGLLAG